MRVIIPLAKTGYTTVGIPSVRPTLAAVSPGTSKAAVIAMPISLADKL